MKSYKEKKLRLEQELNNYRNSIETEIKLHKQQSLERRKELEASQQAELSGKGADTAALGKYDARILQIQKELAYIEKHFPDTIRRTAYVESKGKLYLHNFAVERRCLRMNWPRLKNVSLCVARN